MRVICGVVKRETREQATEACGNNQFCAGLKCGIEGRLHAVRAFWPQSEGWEETLEEADGEVGEATPQLGEEGETAAEEERPLTQEHEAGEAGEGEARPEPIRGGAAKLEECYA